MAIVIYFNVQVIIRVMRDALPITSHQSLITHPENYILFPFPFLKKTNFARLIRPRICSLSSGKRSMAF